MNVNHQYFEANKALWNTKARLHLEGTFYNIPAFKAGKTTMNKIELDEMPDLRDKEVLHLQCHFGQDSISMARAGAKVTAIDFSDEALEIARNFSNELNVPVNFIESNVLTIDEVLDQKFDIVFSSYGVICWFGALDIWAKQIYDHLKPNGIFQLVEFHPTLWMVDFPTQKIAYNYFGDGKPYEEINTETYGNKEVKMHEKEYFWVHSLGQVMQALTNAGLKINSFNEYDYSPYECFERMEKRAEGEFIYKINDILLPMIYSLQCIKPE